MPPVPPIKSSRPTAYPGSSSSSITKKRSSVSPAEAASGTMHNYHQPGKLAGMGPKREISPTKQRIAQAQAQAAQVQAQAQLLAEQQRQARSMQQQQQQQMMGGQQRSQENRLLFEDEYAREVEAHMREMEDQTIPSAEFIDMQPELQWYMRPYLVDFLIEIHQQFRLRPEVLYLALNIVDRYVSKRVVYKKHYQLVGCAALWIAAKFEDAKDKVPTVKELADMCCGAYDATAFLQMEGHLLQTIGWCIGHPTAEAWLRLYCQGTKESTQVQHVARFIMECTLFTRDFVGLKSSSVAKGSLLMARHVCGLASRADLGPGEKEVKHVTTCLDTLFAEHSKSVSTICIEKYAPAYYSKASTMTMQYYASGRRYRHIELPITPAVSLSANLISSWSRRGSEYSNSSPSGIYSTASSDCGDDTLPRTPCTPVGAVGSIDPFVVVQVMNAAAGSSASVGSASDQEGMAVSVNGGGSAAMKENMGPGNGHAGVGMVGGKKVMMSGSGNISAQGYATSQQQRMVLQSVQPQGPVPRLRRLSN